jgi:6-pyruvoyltetrahydropterin/6-carboxytetrahydropterin synthase
MLIRKSFSFEAAHVLPYHMGKCSRLHGHSYRLEVSVSGPLRDTGPERGMVMDFSELSKIVKNEIVDSLDHYYLNDILENPTCERLLEWIADRLSARLPLLHEVVLWETATSCAVLQIEQPALVVPSERVSVAVG